MKRRDFLNTSAVATTGLTILPIGMLRASAGPNSRLDIAVIGVWGRASAHYGWLKEQNVVAVCDINEAFFKQALEQFPGATTYIDWRKCLDHKGLATGMECRFQIACSWGHGGSGEGKRWKGGAA